MATTRDSSTNGLPQSAKVPSSVIDNSTLNPAEARSNTTITVFDGIYTKFDPVRDIVNNNKEVVTEAVWSSGVGSMSTFYTSSTQFGSTSAKYYLNVYQSNPQIDNTAVPQFAVAYGNYYGSGSAVISSYGSDATLTPSKAIYSQYANLLTSPTQKQFSINGTNISQIAVININRARVKESIDPGNWEIQISGSITAQPKLQLVDLGVDTNNLPSYNDGDRYYYVVSGSLANGITTPATPEYYGLMYPDHGILILDVDKIHRKIGVGIVSSSGYTGNNNSNFFNALSGSAVKQNSFTARNAQSINSTYYYVRLFNSQYNFSNNPTFVTGSYGDLKFREMVKDPKVYVSTIGLYNDSNELLAVAKISKALLKSFTLESIISVKLDF